MIENEISLLNKSTYNIEDWENSVELLLKLRIEINSHKTTLWKLKIQNKIDIAKKTLQLKSEYITEKDAKWVEKIKWKYTEIEIKSIILQDLQEQDEEIIKLETLLDMQYWLLDYLKEKIQVIRFIVKWDQWWPETII